MRLLDKIKDHILLMDGAMGTYYNQQYGTELEAEEANLVHPEEITAIHKAYIEAGAELIRTNMSVYVGKKAGTVRKNWRKA